MFPPPIYFLPFIALMLRTHTAGHPSEPEEEENVFFIFHFIFFLKKKEL